MPSSKMFTEPGALATLESLLELGSPAHPDLLQMGLLMRSPGDLVCILKFEVWEEMFQCRWHWSWNIHNLKRAGQNQNRKKKCRNIFRLCMDKIVSTYSRWAWVHNQVRLVMETHHYNKQNFKFPSIVIRQCWWWLFLCLIITIKNNN